MEALLALLALLSLCPHLGSDTPDTRDTRGDSAEADDDQVRRFVHPEFATGSWGGIRDELDDRGMRVEGIWIHDFSRVLEGGLDEGTTARNLAILDLTFDLERLVGLPGTVFAEFYSQVGRDGSNDVGDVQAYSNIDEANVTQLAELWYERVAADRRWRLKVGKLDANGEFAFPDAGIKFLQSSAAYSPTMFALPTYPDPAVSANLFLHPREDWRLGLGVYNAQDGGTVSGRRGLTAELDELFLIGEVMREWEGGRARLGGWWHTGTFATLDGGQDTGTGGPYAMLEQRVFERDVRALDVFFQVGTADDHVGLVDDHLAVGLLATGLIPSRSTWTTGLYLSRAGVSEVGAAGGGAETAIELFQELALTPWLSVIPDLQFIDDPARDAGPPFAGDALVATVRVELFL